MATKDVGDGGGAGEGLVDLHRSAAWICIDRADPGPLQCLNKDVSTFLRLARGETRNPRLGREGGGVGDGGGEGILKCVGDGERSQSELLAILADGDDGEGCFSTRLGGFAW